MAKYVLLDTETTGAGDTDRIIQLGFMVLDGKKVEVHNDLCSAPLPIGYGAMEVHGITPDMIEGKPPCTETSAFQALCALNTPENILIIHNAPFDLGMLAKEDFTSQMRLIDTLRCARHLFDDEEAHRLQYFRYRLGLYKIEQAEADALGIEVKAHDAIGDVLVLKLFLSELRKRLQERFEGVNPIDKMVELTQTPVFYTRPLKFGKYKGKTLTEIAEADKGYLTWMLNNMDTLDEDMRYSIGKVLG
ncbi:MAG: exonuclease domain-containing protein [Sulfuricurvum sp.]|uniref:exonuclease domain-containing protein n=1 Tax=Sulfuricurvum sp. TaxID=2025608 RepID=UPI0026394865|nr:exonuclease domain-containing protein [Sulfuricurvum sp.]MDD2370179.1 exonuclease domain-containing protein [Sulfuricurvum sp.]MDD5119575.1 exonuclease domain-containing protein [Sulfuricurvum sp.]